MNKISAIFLSALLLISFSLALQKADAALAPVTINSNGLVTYNRVATKSLLSSERTPDANSDYIEDNYPLSIWHTSGSFQGGKFIDVTVTNFDGDLYSELLISSLASGPLNGFNHDGSIRSGFPITGGGVAYSASIDNYVVAAFHVICDPGCNSRLNLYDGTGTLLWSKVTLGVGVTAAPVMYKEGGEIFIIYEDSYNTYLVDIEGDTLPGWPKFSNPHTFATADFDDDGENEIVVAPQSGNDHTTLQIYRKDATLLSETASFGLQVRVYPVIGDVDGDGELEIVVIGRQSSSPYNAQLNIFNYDGTLQASYTVDDRTSYGTQASLADMNADSIPEMLFMTNDLTYVMDHQGNHLPGWPKVHFPTSSYNNDSNIVVGDIVSDGDREYPEVVYTHKSGNTNFGTIKIFNHDGSEVEKWDGNQLYPISTGRSNAIADIDADGFNEIIIAGKYWDGHSGYYPAIWAIDLNKHERPVDHGGIQWGGYSNDSGKSGLYINPLIEQ
ncbi:MAG: VCBS repeat-containing protein [Candidatus Dojkabacteria bacterium]|nr:MAG: VCBS repeat-containing protein [Candidatus Dojkabacteria bacterium]